MTALRERAADVAAQVAGRLADSGKVTERSNGWMPLSLSEGNPAVAVLFAELGHAEPSARGVAHRYLAESVAAMRSDGPLALYVGPAAVAFAASRAAHRPGDYRGILGPLDERIAVSTRRRLRAEWERLRAGRAGITFSDYDAIEGLSGIGRYLLDRQAVNGPARAALLDILRYLVALNRPVPRPDAGPPLPGWWVTHTPNSPEPLADLADGHLNLGLAHGVAGPLALLALCTTAGVEVSGQREAIADLVTLLLDHRRQDADGPHWPALLTHADLDAPHPGPRPRSSWCYGVPGIARALHLAGIALDRLDWTACALDALRGLLTVPVDHQGILDAGLCHGWAGLLHVTRLSAADAAGTADGAALGPLVDHLAGRVMDRFESDTPFGFRIATPDGLIDRAGFLEGAAGTALALHGFATGLPPASRWDAALLVA